jgi:DNA ligase-1
MPGMLLREVVDTSARVAGTSKRLEKTAALASVLGAAEPEHRALVARYLAGELRQKKLGVGYAQLNTLRDVPPREAPTLTLTQVDATFEAIATARGAGSAGRRSALLRELFGAATRDEQSFLARLIQGELRQGALESLLVDAIARAARVPVEAVRRAQMLAADLDAITQAAFGEGEAALARFGLTLFRPVQPMLADSAEDVADALAQLGRAAFEVKLDGARVQVHRAGDEVRVYTRSLNEVTPAVPELVELVRALPCRDIVLDGEVIALRPDGKPHPFQDTMRRFGRKLDVAALQRELPLSTFFFDCLFLDGESLLDRPTEERVAALARVVPPEACVQRLVSADKDEAERLLHEVLARGHEGVMAKALEAPYFAGRRGASWLKIKHAHTLDLVVLGVEWGSGRRSGLLSNLHLGARDTESGEFVMLGKTFKGLTDELLRWQTAELLLRETHRDAYTVYVRPELVVEIAFNDVQTSPVYPAGLALRFARVKRYRPDKRAEDADTLETIRAIHARARD